MELIENISDLSTKWIRIEWMWLTEECLWIEHNTSKLYLTLTHYSSYFLIFVLFNISLELGINYIFKFPLVTSTKKPQNFCYNVLYIKPVLMEFKLLDIDFNNSLLFLFIFCLNYYKIYPPYCTIGYSLIISVNFAVICSNIIAIFSFLLKWIIFFYKLNILKYFFCKDY